MSEAYESNEPVNMPASPPAEDLLADLVNGPVSGPATCACGKTIVKMPGGHWRSTESDHTSDRIHCGADPARKRHQPVEPPAGLRHIKPPWTRPEPEFRTGNLS